MLKGDKVILRPMRREYLEKYQEYLNEVDLLLLSSDEAPMPMEPERLLKQLHVDFDPRLALGNLIGILFESVAEEHLVQPAFIYDYPIELSPLSKQKAGDPSLVERFELYIGGMEIANGYSELNDPIDQRERFLSQLQARERGDEEAHEMDDDYIRALSYGMPPTAGEGIGVDRLTMLLTNSTSIRDVILFPHLRAE